MAISNNNHESDTDNVCVEVTGADTNNEDVKSSLVHVISNEKKKRKRFPHRPYASPTTRIITKCGKGNVLNINIPQKGTRYFKDLGNTLLSIRWRWILLSLCVANAIVYVFFTILWMIAVQCEESYMDENNKFPCIIGGSSFSAYLVLVVETITTIGSGGIYPTECQSGWIMITFQALAGVAIEGALVSAVFVKMSRPRSKNTTRHFSKKCIISLRDGAPCLIFRIQDEDGKYLTKTVVKAVLIKKRHSLEGEWVPFYFQNLKLEAFGLLMWPQEVIHKIDEGSPFWNMSRHDLYEFRFEIMIVLEGDSLTTGQPSQSQTSYTNKEILWGYRFSSCVEYDIVEQKYVVNERMFNNIEKCEIPECSAAQLLRLHVPEEQTKRSRFKTY